MSLWTHSLGMALLLSSLLVAVACKKKASSQNTDQTMDCPHKIQQGIAGRIVWREGNWMPAPDAPPRQDQGIVRKIHIYEATRTSDTEKDDSHTFYTQVRVRRIAIVQSDHNGCFQIELPPGRYSLFSEESEGLFARLFDGEGYIHPVEVKAGQLATTLLIVDYKAAY